MGKKKQWSEITTSAEAIAKVSSKYQDGSLEQFYTIEGFKAGERWHLQSLRNKQLYDLNMVKKIAREIHQETIKDLDPSVSEIKIIMHFNALWEKLNTK